MIACWRVVFTDFGPVGVTTAPTVYYHLFFLDFTKNYLQWVDEGHWVADAVSETVCR